MIVIAKINKKNYIVKHKKDKLCVAPQLNSVVFKIKLKLDSC